MFRTSTALVCITLLSGVFAASSVNVNSKYRITADLKLLPTPQVLSESKLCPNLNGLKTRCNDTIIQEYQDMVYNNVLNSYPDAIYSQFAEGFSYSALFNGSFTYDPCYYYFKGGDDLSTCYSLQNDLITNMESMVVASTVVASSFSDLILHAAAYSSAAFCAFCEDETYTNTFETPQSVKESIDTAYLAFTAKVDDYQKLVSHINSTTNWSAAPTMMDYFTLHTPLCCGNLASFMSTAPAPYLYQPGVLNVLQAKFIEAILVSDPKMDYYYPLNISISATAPVYFESYYTNALAKFEEKFSTLNKTNYFTPSISSKPTSSEYLTYATRLHSPRVLGILPIAYTYDALSNQTTSPEGTYCVSELANKNCGATAQQNFIQNLNQTIDLFLRLEKIPEALSEIKASCQAIPDSLLSSACLDRFSSFFDHSSDVMNEVNNLLNTISPYTNELYRVAVAAYCATCSGESTDLVTYYATQDIIDNINNLKDQMLKYFPEAIASSEYFQFKYHFGLLLNETVGANVLGNLYPLGAKRISDIFTSSLNDAGNSIVGLVGTIATYSPNDISSVNVLANTTLSKGFVLTTNGTNSEFTAAYNANKVGYPLKIVKMDMTLVKEHKGLSGGKIAAAVIFSIIGALLIIAGCWACFRKSKNHTTTPITGSLA